MIILQTIKEFSAFRKLIWLLLVSHLLFLILFIKALLLIRRVLNTIPFCNFVVLVVPTLRSLDEQNDYLNTNFLSNHWASFAKDGDKD